MVVTLTLTPSYAVVFIDMLDDDSTPELENSALASTVTDEEVPREIPAFQVNVSWFTR